MMGVSIDMIQGVLVLCISHWSIGEQFLPAISLENRRRPYRITGAGEVALREQLKTLHQVVSVGEQRLASG